MRRSRIRLLAGLATLALAASCNSNNSPPDIVRDPVVVTPTPPPASPTSFNVIQCFTQTVRPGRSLAGLVVPDVLTIDLDQPASFPNGRTPSDPVIDRTLAMAFLDLKTHSIDTFANIPVNPRGDRVLPTSFPWLASAFGGQRPSLGGVNFNFRTDPESAYTRVDRMGMPAIATALVGTSAKDRFNDDSPADDLTAPTGVFKWVPEFQTQLTALTNALADDFRAAGFTLCAQPVS